MINQDIPTHWSWTTISQIMSSIKTGTTPPSKNSEYYDGGIPWYTPGDIGKRKFLQESVRSISQEAISANKARVFEENTLLITCIGNIGRVGISQQKCSANQQITGITIKEDIVSLDFAYWWFRLIQPKLQEIAPGGIISIFNQSNLKRVTVPIPYPDEPERSLAEQRRIVAQIEALLGEVREMRALHEQITADTGRLMESVLEETFGSIRNGFDTANIPESETDFIGKICTLNRGKFSHRPRNDPRFFGGKYPWMQINNIPKDNSKYIVSHMGTLNDEGLAISKMFPAGTVVISIAATIGAVGVMTFDACFPDSLVGINPKQERIKDIDMDFFFWQLLYMRSHLESIAPYAAQKNINLEILNQLKIWLPKIDIQQQIGRNLDSMKEEIMIMQSLNKNDSSLIDQLEQSILAQAFKGEL